MSCICCKNPYKICVPLCKNGASIEIPISSVINGIYYLDLEYQGAIHTVMKSQLIGQIVTFDFLPNQLNEDYCYNGFVYYYNSFGIKIIVNFAIDGINYDCINFCTSINV
jgi:hypothetical protein